MTEITRIPLDVVVTETGDHTSGLLVAVMVSDLDELEARLQTCQENLDVERGDKQP